MGFISKDKEQLVNEVIERLKESLPENTDFSDGLPLRNIIETLMEQLDIQYWQLEQVYNSAYIDDAFDEDLDKVVAIFSMARKEATFAMGKVRFYRNTPADRDYLIPIETLVETYPDANGVKVQFQTTEDAVLAQGTTEVIVPITAVIAGETGNLAPNTIKVINTPPAGIESVINDLPTSDGYERETDESLRDRAKHAIETVGSATIEAIKYKIEDILGIRQVNVLDMARGIGTFDVLVLAESMPISDYLKGVLNEALQKVKSAGIDGRIVEPEFISIDMEIRLVLNQGYTVDDVKEAVLDSINDYLDSLGIGDDLIVNQVERMILNTDENIRDVITINPAKNVEVTDKQIIKVNSITLI